MKLDFKPLEIFNFDVLIIGSGGAGLRAAIEAKKFNSNLKVLVVSKGKTGYGNNTVVSEGYFNTLGFGDKKDSSEIFASDIMAAGRHINNPKLIKTFVEHVGQLVFELKKFGVKFKEKNGRVDLLKVPGHTYARTVHVIGSGKGIIQPLYQYASKIGVQFKDGVLITKILKNGDVVVGAVGVGRNGGIYVFNAKSTILATGGGGWIYARSNNPGGMTGDGYILAYEVGLPLMDMEFVQFYPTYVFEKGLRLLLLYEKLVVQGAILRNFFGENIIKKYGITSFSQLTRDLLSRILMFEILGGRGKNGLIELDLTTLNREAVNDYLKLLASKGFPLEREKVYVSPVAHFFMGGIKIDEFCQTGLEGLYAVGEVTGGLHGANRLGGNALSEIFVFGKIAGKNAAIRASNVRVAEEAKKEVSGEVSKLKNILNQTGDEKLEKIQQKFRETMWYKVGIIRDRENLREALEMLNILQENVSYIKVENFFEYVRLLELKNMITLGLLISKAALHREESRGSHYRLDYPDEDKNRIKNIIISRKNGKPTISIEEPRLNSLNFLGKNF